MSDEQKQQIALMQQVINLYTATGWFVSKYKGKRKAPLQAEVLQFLAETLTEVEKQKKQLETT